MSCHQTWTIRKVYVRDACEVLQGLKENKQQRITKKTQVSAQSFIKKSYHHSCDYQTRFPDCLGKHCLIQQTIAANDKNAAR